MWNTGNANEIAITGVGTVAAKGTTSVVPQSSTTYVLTAEGPGGSKEASARVTVIVPPLTMAKAGADDEQLFSQNMKDIFFAYDKYSVPENEQRAIERDARFLIAHPNYKLLISGHCDERGSEEYNLGWATTVPMRCAISWKGWESAQTESEPLAMARRNRSARKRRKPAGNSIAGRISPCS